MKHEMSYFRRVLAALCLLGLWSPNWLPKGPELVSESPQ
jgi:hypothetical protein